MHKLLPHILIALILALAATACRRTDPAALSAMERADSLIDSHPDSALTLLQQIDPARLGPRADRARYALLLTMALDKNWLAPANDSLIALASDFYERGNDPLSLTMAEYYRGRVNFNAGSLTPAMAQFYRAKELAEANGLDFWAGMACRGIADIYAETFNDVMQLESAKLELQYLQKSGRQPYLNYALLDMANALINNDLFAEADSLTTQAIDSARVTCDSDLFYSSLQLIGLNQLKQNNNQKALQIYRELCSLPESQRTDSLNLAICYARTEAIDSAGYILSQIKDENSNLDHYAKYTLYKYSKQWELALKEMERGDNLADERYKEALQHNLANSLTQHYKANELINLERIKNYRYSIWLIAIIAIAIVVFTSYYFYTLNRRQQQIIDSKIIFAEQLNEMLDKSRKQNDSDKIVIDILKTTGNELLEDLCQIVAQNVEKSVTRRKIADKVTTLIKDLSFHSSTVVALEQKVDLLYDNVYTHFCQDLPNLKEADYRLFVFSALKISSATIALFLQEHNVSAIYNRKRHLKDKIKTLHPDKATRYITHLA